MPSNHAALLAVIADHLERYHEQVGDLLPTYQQSDPSAGSDGGSADMVNALVESERSLRSAARALRKASKLADAE
jgi:hypothetical protein